MSHITRVQTTFKDKATLLAALGDLGYVVEERKASLITEGGRARQEIFDLVVTGSPQGRVQALLAFQKKGDSYEVIADWYFHRMSQRDFLGPISQRYGLRVAQENLEKQGFKVAFRIEEKGKSVRLILCRKGEQVDCTAGADGEIVLTATGFQGSDCVAATGEVEELIGEVKDRELTVEGYFGPIPQSVHPEHEYVS